MIIYDILPNLIAIVIIISSRLSTVYLKNRIEEYQFRRPTLEQSKEDIKNIALDWGDRLTFFNSMFASFFTAASILARTESYGWVVATFTFLLLLFFAGFWWGMGRRLGEWEDTILGEAPLGPLGSLKITRAGIYNTVLVIVNLVLILVLYFTRPMETQPGIGNFG